MTTDTSSKKMGVKKNDEQDEQDEEEHPLWELIKFSALALLIVIPIRTWIAQPFIVSGDSMLPTFKNGQYLIVDQVSYYFREPARGEVIIFHYPKDVSKYFIKRIVGLPEETIEIEGGQVKIINEASPDGLALDESFIAHPADNHLKINLSSDEYFVIGDNRAFSSDSRRWGTLPKKLIVGRAVLRLFPVSQADVLPGDVKY